MEKIIFSPKGHTYTRQSDGMRLMSVSHFKSLFDDTDWTHNVRKKAAQNYLKATKYKTYKDLWERDGKNILDPAFIEYLLQYMDKKTFERMCKEVRAEWDAAGLEARIEGTARHEAKEAADITAGFSINPYDGLEYPTREHGKLPDGGNSTIVESLMDLKDGYYPELILWKYFPEPIFSQSMECDICGVCGTSDKVYIQKPWAYVGDYKFTGKPLSDFAVPYKNIDPPVHLPPFDHYPTTKLSGYKIQLNTYGFFLEDHGYDVLDLRVHNTVTKTEKEEEFIIPYIPEPVEEAFDRVFMESL